MKKGIFISLEGVDGCGKTTISQRLRERLQAKCVPVVSIREPGGTIVGEKIRDLLLHYTDATLDCKTEALLFAASRAQLTHEVINPALEQGNVVIGDRFIDSSLVYQVSVRGLVFEDIYQLNLFATSGNLPDITFFLDVDYSLVPLRMGKTDRIENDVAFSWENIVTAYRQLSTKFPQRIVIIDANQDIDEVFNQIITHLKERYDEFDII